MAAHEQDDKLHLHMALETLNLERQTGIDTGFFARGGNIFIECAEADV